MNSDHKKRIINSHTHIFTIDHVPNEFGRALLPRMLSKILTIRVVKWYFKNYTVRGSKKYRLFVHRAKKAYYKFLGFLKATYVLWWAYFIIIHILKWAFDKILKFLNAEKIFSDEFKALIARFYTMGRYSIHYEDQKSIYNFLKKNYPEKTRFVVLTMDMEYMAAGKPKISFQNQIDEVIRLKKSRSEMYPFIFIDPRRIVETRNNTDDEKFSVYCKALLSKTMFNGIKIYPALGYYPFDKNLIEMYEYAIDNNIPVMTHCIRGVVFYRGPKEKDWESHPILKYNKKNKQYENIPLPQKRNVDFTTNFTHPLNYHCLLDKSLLNGYLATLGFEREVDLSKLKICLAHFGGEDEWEKYKHDAWNNYNNNIPPVNTGRKNTLTHESKRTIWWNASWLSIICDLIHTYENVYTDVSFVLYNEELFPTLRYLLLDEKVKTRILFGSDFYVVSQKGVDKVLYHKLRSYLGEDLFMQIAYTNACEYLSSKLTKVS